MAKIVLLFFFSLSERLSALTIIDCAKDFRHFTDRADEAGHKEDDHA